MKKITATFEVLAVFIFTYLIIFTIRITPLWEWQNTYLNLEFINSALMFVIPILLLFIAKRDFVAYGLSFKNLRYLLSTALICLIPVAIANMVFSFVDWTSRSGSLVLAADHLVLLLVLAILVKKKPSTFMLVAFSFGFFGFIAYFSFTGDPISGKMLEKFLRFVYYLFFVGFGEEMFFRGYMQSRLNAAFSRPYQFFGVKWGWGIIITSIIFGFGHVFTHFNPFLGELNWNWWWGFWTIFSGLVFGFVREKTGSILVPAIIHGLPLAVGSIFFGI